LSGQSPPHGAVRIRVETRNLDITASALSETLNPYSDGSLHIDVSEYEPNSEICGFAAFGWRRHSTYSERLPVAERSIISLP
jgi:hypothetical protein